MKVLIIDDVPIAKKILTDLNYEVSYQPKIPIEEISKISNDYDAMVVRSSKIHEVDFGSKIKAIGRAGAGVNNIPIEKAAEQGIVVFNTPGANSNAVKELVICSLILASRGVVQGIEWAKTIENDLVKTVEKNKKNFKGSEIYGKKLAVIGLGAIGMLVSNAACGMGMQVTGYDPYITIENAWKLSRDVKKEDDLKKLVSDVDFITVHVPIMEQTKDMINKELFDAMTPGVKLLNFARGGIVNNDDLLQAIDKEKVERYITDFPDEKLAGNEKVTIVPHLGAGTHEADENCGMMVARQINEFLAEGNIINSVNYPKTLLEKNGATRISICNQNVPGIVNKISEVIAKEKLNIHGMINKSRGDFAYNIIDIDGDVTKDNIKKLKEIQGVLTVRLIK